MGFISFNLDFYIKELRKLESVTANAETIYRARQLLKMLDDLIDENYIELSDTLEKTCQGVSRLRKYLADNAIEPFPVHHKLVSETNITYEQNEIELIKAIDALIQYAENSKCISDNIFLTKLIHFCEWIGYEKDTAYVFLLRDTLLPYVYYRGKNRMHLYPWLLGRKAFAMLAGKEHVDDEIRASIMKALESGGYYTFDDFCNIVLPDMRATITKYSEIENYLTALLDKITEKHIIVIESGCSGTFPMLLKSLDERVDMRMYTTYPYLLDIYTSKIYSPKYEENRLFETLYSQDLYFQLSDLRDGCFYVRKCQNKNVEKNTILEIRTVLDTTLQEVKLKQGVMKQLNRSK